MLHEFADAAVRDEHVQGWRYQLSLFSNAVSDVVHAGAAAVVDRWFRAWSEPVESELRAHVAAVGTSDVSFNDRFSHVVGLTDLVPHVLAVQRFMPGLRIRRRGDVRHCQGTLLVAWEAVDANDAVRGSGTNVFRVDAEGRIESVTGFWDPPA